MVFDALIIGGGPAGATAALLLAQAGWSVAIVEKKIFPRPKVCGEFVSATNLPLLKKLGIVDFYLAHGGPEVHSVGLFARDVMLSSAMPATDQGHWGRALGREYLDTNLLEMAVHAGASLWQAWHVKTVERVGAYFTSTMISKDATQQLTSRLVIIANGSWERELMKSSRDMHRPSDLLAFKAHFINSTLPSGLMPLLAFPGGYGGLVHTNNGRVALSCCIRRDKLYEIRKVYSKIPAGEAVFQHIITTCLGVKKMLAQAKREDAWLSAGPIRPGIRKCYADGIFFVGNIAGEAHPIIAEGISMAMQSAWLLSQTLLAQQNDLGVTNVTDTIGQSYSQQWKAHFHNRIRAAFLFAQFAMHPWAVNLILPILTRFPHLLTFGAKCSGKINQVVPYASTFSTLIANEKENAI